MDWKNIPTERRNFEELLGPFVMDVLRGDPTQCVVSGSVALDGHFGTKFSRGSDIDLFCTRRIAKDLVLKAMARGLKVYRYHKGCYTGHTIERLTIRDSRCIDIVVCDEPFKVIEGFDMTHNQFAYDGRFCWALRYNHDPYHSHVKLYADNIYAYLNELNFNKPTAFDTVVLFMGGNRRPTNTYPRSFRKTVQRIAKYIYRGLTVMDVNGVCIQMDIATVHKCMNYEISDEPYLLELEHAKEMYFGPEEVEEEEGVDKSLPDMNTLKM